MAETIKLSCVLTAAEIGARTPDVVLFPEGVAKREIERAESSLPDALIIGAIERGRQSVAVLQHRTRNQLDYRKIGSDGRTLGVGNPPVHLPVFVSDRAAVGVVICMDVQESAWVKRIIDALRQAATPLKLLCIPADMSADYFQGPMLQPYLHGAHVALCNHVRSNPDHRRPSFVTDVAGHKRVVQEAAGPLHVELPLGGHR